MTTLAVTLTLAVPAAQAEGSGATVGQSAVSSSAAEHRELERVAPDRCQSSRKAVAYYRAHTHARQSARGGELADRTPVVRGRSCHWARYAAGVWVARAKAALKALRAWEYDYAWWQWMPAKHRRIGACETGYGREPGDFSWDSGRYVSFAGIYRAGYDDDAHRVGNLGWDETKRKLGRLPTPREQMQAVDSHRAAHGGWSGWGCRGA